MDELGHSTLSEKEIAALREAFCFIDSNNDGTLNTKELGSVLRTLARNPTEAEMHSMMQKIDKDGNGDIDLDEFLHAMSFKRSTPEDDNRDTFNVFDQNKDGFIGPDDIRHMMSMFGEDFSDDDINEIMKQADTDGDGKITLQDFTNMLEDDGT